MRIECYVVAGERLSYAGKLLTDELTEKETCS